MKKITILLVGLLFAVQAWSQDPVEINGIYYQFMGNNATVVQKPNGMQGPEYSGDIVIPATVTHGGNTYNVTGIGYNIFLNYSSGYSSVNSVTIPSSISSITGNVFKGIWSSITVSPDNPYYCSKNGVLFNKDQSTLIAYPSRKGESYVIPNTVNIIGVEAFSECHLISVIIPNSVTTIEDRAFSSCSFTSITIPNSVLSIGYGAFSGSKITSVNISGNVIFIGDEAFARCSDLTGITVNSDNLNYSDKDGVLFNKNQTILLTYPGGMVSTSYTIPNTVTKIGSYAFTYTRKLTTVIIPNSVNTIEDDAFSHSGLTTITIPNSVTSIGDYVFYYCGNLRSVIISDSILNIKYMTFYGCEKLASVHLGKGVQLISNYAFASCDSLKDFYSPVVLPPTTIPSGSWSGSFNGTNQSTCTLHVPAGSKKYYDTAAVWKDFSSIVEDVKFTYTITTVANPANGGTITGAGEYKQDSTATLQAIPNQGYKFKYWQENGDSVYNLSNYSFIVKEARNLTAVFASIPQYSITAIATPIGSGSASGSGAYWQDSTVNLQATANADYEFLYWQDGNTIASNQANFSFKATANSTLIAVFKAKEKYTITAIATPVGSGSVSGGGEYKYDSTVNLQATANTGYEFVYWQEGNAIASEQANFSFKASTNRTLIAVFKAKEKYTIAVAASPIAGGTVSGGGEVEKNASVTLQATAAQGYVFKYWRECMDSVSAQANYSFPATANRNLTAVFESTTTGIQPMPKPEVESFHIYPNPTTSQLRIEISPLTPKKEVEASASLRGGTTKQSLVEIYDIAGKQVGVYNVTGEETTIDVSTLSSGVYFVKVGNEIRKVVKQ